MFRDPVVDIKNVKVIITQGMLKSVSRNVLIKTTYLETLFRHIETSY